MTTIMPNRLSFFGRYTPQTDFPLIEEPGDDNPSPPEARILDKPQLEALADIIAFARRLCLTPTGIEVTAAVLSQTAEQAKRRDPLATLKPQAEAFVTDWFESNATEVVVDARSGEYCPSVSYDKEKSPRVRCYISFELVEAAGYARTRFGSAEPEYIYQCLYPGICLAYMYQLAISAHYREHSPISPSRSSTSLDLTLTPDMADTQSTASQSDPRESGWRWEEEVIGGCVSINAQATCTCGRRARQYCHCFKNQIHALPFRILDSSAQMPFYYFGVVPENLTRFFQATFAEMESLLPLRRPSPDYFEQLTTPEGYPSLTPENTIWRGPGEPHPILTPAYIPLPLPIPGSRFNSCGTGLSAAACDQAKRAFDKRDADR